MVRPIRGLVLHIEDGTESGTDAWFHDPANTNASAHFGSPEAGILDQWVDTDDAAWAIRSGNGHWISLENEGRTGDTLSSDPSRNAAELLAWLHATEGVPLRKADAPTESGLGYHSMGGAAWGHIFCPGPKIVAQRDEIIARATEIATGLDTEAVPAGESVVPAVSYALPSYDSGHPYPPNDRQLDRELATIRASYLAFLEQSSQRCGFAVSIIAGIGSRESAWGDSLTPPGPAGTGDRQPRHGRLPPDGLGFGRGLMQIDYDAHQFARTGPWRDPRENILYACEVLTSSLRYIIAHTGLTGADRVRGAIAGYNAGPGNVARSVAQGLGIDYYTVHHNYSSDVVARAQCFHDHGLP